MGTKIKQSIRSFYLFIMMIIFHISVFAQEKVEINGQDVGSWFERNWIWVSGAVLLILLFAIIGGGNSKKRKTTTVIKDEMGNVKSVTTTEVRD